ncbi:hypothetical protein B0I00_1460 [Novosphingobium kunmingense]|uniref:Dolichyl-phosphate-mannose-protein mannosyltransferase n=1 Tax=Novosphingobium kunmingense TaxID=1211806 RepID=A0A2N0HJV0_9SPHN|nr:hypothetical protein [Novosphingobium kunmingense]PKB19230.1 hypothetical protein B0I00_1460 [Novosphingobium kunmingense]
MLRLLLLALALIIAIGPARAQTIDKDRELYAAITRQVDLGEPYYRAATDLQRANGYPVRPFYTVRPPTLTWLAATVGPLGLVILAYAAVLVGVFGAMQGIEDRRQRLTFVALYAVASGAIVSPASLQFTELWCGLLASAALCWTNWRTRLALAAAAALFREFGALLICAILAFAILAGKRREAAWAAAALVVLGALLYLHAQAVLSYAMTGDPASQGWFALRGPAGLVSDLAKVTAYGFLPAWAIYAAVVLSLIGWLRRSPLTGIWLGGFSLTVMVASRPDNYYWAQVLMPLLPAGLAFLIPRQRPSPITP